MKTPFRRQLMFVLLAAFAALPLIAAPAPDTLSDLTNPQATVQTVSNSGIEVAAFTLKQSGEDGLFLSEDAFPEDLAELVALIVKADQLATPEMLQTNNYIFVKDESGCALAAIRAKETTHFTLADNEKAAMTLRPLVAIRTEDASYILLAVYRAMNTEVPVPPTVLARANTGQGGKVFQVNTQYDKVAATFQPDSSVGWGAAN